MNRRQALRAAAAIGAGLTAAGCADRPSTRTAGPMATRSPITLRRPASSSSPAGASAAGGASPATGTSSGGAAPALPPEVTHGPRDRPAIAMTFHGQGEPAVVTELLSRLEANDVRVTVLAVGSWLTAQPNMARRILDGGHELGNHTQHHLDIARMNDGQAFREIDECARTLQGLTGSVGIWFRPSQTQHATPVIRAQATRAGYRTCLSYDVDSLDYTDPPVATVVNATLGGIRNGSIVSMHCGHAVTIAALGPILDGLRTRGLHTATMSQLVAR
jgi:peptidoglycan/xylan/chitin deacetylase (PgdA/CDA1 family)